MGGKGSGRRAKPEPLLFPGSNSKRTGQDDIVILQPPSWLNESAAERFRNLAGKLAEIGLTTALDEDELARYCWAFDKLVEAARELDANGMFEFHTNKHGEENRKLSEALNAFKKLELTVDGIGKNFGLNPSDRRRLKLAAQAEEEADPLEQMANRHREKRQG